MNHEYDKPFKVIVFGVAGVGKSGKAIKFKSCNLEPKDVDAAIIFGIHVRISAKQHTFAKDRVQSISDEYKTCNALLRFHFFNHEQTNCS